MLWKLDVPQNFINEAALWDYFYQLCSIFPHLIFFQYTPSLHFQVYCIYNEAKAAPELVQAPPAIQGKSCAAMALLPRRVGGEVRRKLTHFKSRRRFQGQQSLSHTLPCKRHCSFPSQPCSPSQALESPGRWEAPGLGNCSGGARAETGKETSHQGSHRRDKLMADAVAPTSSPRGWGRWGRDGQLRPQETCRHFPKTQR